MKPLCIDLCCGRFGWGKGFRDAGFQVIGIDNDGRCGVYADGMTFIEADIRDVSGWDFPRARAVVASPPCTEFSTARNLSKRYVTRDPERGMPLVIECERFIMENDPDFWCIENVQGAVSTISRRLGPPRLSKHSFYLWGDFPGFLLPTSNPLRKFHSVETRAGRSHERWGYEGHRSPALRALIPYPLARRLAEACLP